MNIENLNHQGKYLTVKGGKYTQRERHVRSMTPVDVALAAIDTYGFQVDLTGLAGLPADGKLTCTGANLLMERVRS